MDTEKQLHRPTPRGEERINFVEEYAKTLDFEYSLKRAYGDRIRKNKLYRTFHIKQWRRRISKIIPKKVKALLKKRESVSHGNQ